MDRETMTSLITDRVHRDVIHHVESALEDLGGILDDGDDATARGAVQATVEVLNVQLRSIIHTAVAEALVPLDLSDEPAEPTALTRRLTHAGGPMSEALAVRGATGVEILDDAMNLRAAYGDTAAERALRKGDKAVDALREEIAANTRHAESAIQEAHGIVNNAPHELDGHMLQHYLDVGVLDRWFTDYKRWRVNAEQALHDRLTKTRRFAGRRGPIA